MKKKDNLLRGIIIGIGVIIVPLIIMGTTYTTINKKTLEFHPAGGGFELAWLFNNETGELWFFKGTKKGWGKVSGNYNSKEYEKMFE
ncbi:MAG: hypothetical protein VX347_02765 [Bacteroidota bacterium]|nr:hypothetical protein [Bacteroidota bacterium]